MEIDFCLLKPQINLFIKAVMLRDLAPTIYYPKKLILGNIINGA